MSRTGGGKEVLTTAAVAVGVGVGVAALAGLGLAGAALGAGTLLAANNSFARRARPALQPGDVRRDAEGRIENWAQLLKAVQHGVRATCARAAVVPIRLLPLSWGLRWPAQPPTALTPIVQLASYASVCG